jgi:putative endonuclease
MNNKQLGIIGENTAAELLTAKGYRILERNYRCRLGEIDIIADRAGDISFIEVKTRQGISYGRPCESVTDDKKEHIKRVASWYLKEMETQGYKPNGVAFQIIEVTVEHIEDAFF